MMADTVEYIICVWRLL